MVDDQPSTKRCTKCGQSKSRAAFGKHSRPLDGLQLECKACRALYYAAHRQSISDKAKAWRIANPASGAKYRAANRERIQKHASEYYAANSDRLQAKQAAARQANPDLVRAREAAWRAANPEKNRAKVAKHFAANRERVNARHAASARTRPAIRTTWAAIRRARKLGATTGNRKAYAAFVKWARSVAVTPCYWCKKKTKTGHRHIDHIIPLARGGADAVENLCVACPPCNLTKNAKLPEDFCGQSELKLA